MRTFHIIAGLLALVHYACATQQFINMQSHVCNMVGCVKELNLHNKITNPELLFTLALCMGLFYTVIFIVTRRKA